MSRHPTAVIHQDAKIADTVVVGPYAIIDQDVVVAAAAEIGAHVWLTGKTQLGEQVVIHHGAVIGNAPQDLSFDPKTPSNLSIGRGTIVREYATIHRSTSADHATRIGENCFIMAQAHVAHDVQMGNRVILCNNSLVPGHVEIDDRVFVSGNVVIHQFCRIGKGAMIGGAAGVGQDVPPWTTIIGRSEIRSLNTLGMRRAGIDSATRLQIKSLYREIFSKRGHLDHARAVLEAAGDQPEIAIIRKFYARDSRRGFCWPPARADHRIFRSRDDADSER